MAYEELLEETGAEPRPMEVRARVLSMWADAHGGEVMEISADTVEYALREYKSFLRANSIAYAAAPNPPPPPPPLTGTYWAPAYYHNSFARGSPRRRSDPLPKHKPNPVDLSLVGTVAPKGDSFHQGFVPC
jgi:hypothetical protein